MAPTDRVIKLPVDRMPSRRSAPQKKATRPAVNKQAGNIAPAGAVSALWQRLRVMRRFADLRQKDVADKLGKSRATIALWESHLDDIRTSPTAEDVAKYAEVCGVPVAFAMDNRAHPDDVWKLRSNNPRAVQGEAPAAQLNIAAARNSLLGMEDRKAQTFWSAVEFGFRSSGKSESFPPHGGPDFVHNGNAVVFASDTADAKALLVGAMSVLLSHDKSQGRTSAKHVLVYVTGAGKANINESEAEKLWGVSVRQVKDLNDAMGYLQAL